MKIHEYQAKEILAKYGVAVPRGEMANTLEEATAMVDLWRRFLNDCYNSNPEALRSMIRTLAARPAKGRRILVAGEMLEMGEHSPALHAACGRAAAEAGLDLVVAVQGNAEHLATAACAGGVPAVFLRDAETAGQWLKQNIRAGDVVLVKGSRGVHLERAIEAVQRHFAGR